MQIAAAAEVYATEEGIANVYADEPFGREVIDRARASLPRRYLAGDRGRPKAHGRGRARVGSARRPGIGVAAVNLGLQVADVDVVGLVPVDRHRRAQWARFHARVAVQEPDSARPFQRATLRVTRPDNAKTCSLEHRLPRLRLPHTDGAATSALTATELRRLV